MNNRYTAPHLALYSENEDALMLSSEIPGGGGSGVIELPPIPMGKADDYTPPSLDLIEEPDDILMASDEETGGVGDLWDDTEIEMPPIQM